MKIDLGCGSYPRGDIGVTMHIDGVVCEATKHLDKYLAEFGFVYNPNATVIEDDIVRYCEYHQDEFTNHSILLCHVIEHLECPYYLLTLLRKAKDIVVVVPNARVNDADKIDRTHIYSFTEWSLYNLIKKAFGVEPVYRKIEYELDLLAYVFLN